MKRLIAIAVCVLTLISLLAVTASAANTATLAGPATVRAGDTITLTFKMNGSGLLGAEMDSPTYDKTQLELVKNAKKIGGDWVVEFEGSRIVIYDDKQKTPINKNTDIFTYTFKVKNLAVGTKISVSINNVILSDGKKDIPMGTVSYSATIAEPLSKDNALKSLTVSNATISPAFDSNTTTYTAEVPFEVSKLDVKATANDAKAKINVNSPTLKAGGTTKVTVTVTAENGSTKTYTIAVKRAQDPNYVASGNNALSDITVDGYRLSPAFDAENTNYVIWLPYETESVIVNGVAADALASVRVEGGENLTAGADNEIKVICTAEDGTEKVYTVVAKRAPAHGGATEPTQPTQPTQPTNPTTAPSTDPTTAPQPTTGTPATNPTTAPQIPSEGEKTEGIPMLVFILVTVAALGVGVVVGIVIGKKKN